MASHPLLILFTTVSMLFVMAYGQDNNIAPPSGGVAFSCSTTDDYTNGSQYKKNLDQLLATLPAAAGDNGGFYKGSAGAGADEVFGLIMCFADRNATQCRECLADAAAGIKRECPGSRSVRAMYEACMLRYSPEPIPATVDVGSDFARYVYGDGDPTPMGLGGAWLPLMSKLTAGVTACPLRLANDSAPYWSSQEMVYGLAQCTRDLNGTECTRCINYYSGRLENTFPNNTGGAMKGYSCYLRYQLGAFQITLPPMPPHQQPTYHEPPSSSKTGLAIGLSIGAAAFMIVLASLIRLHRLRRQKRARILLNEARERELEEGDFLLDEPAMEEEFEKGAGPKRFRYGELAIATDNFSDSQKLGEGGFGSVYRGFLREMNLHVAIKRVSKGSRQGRKEYASEVRIISRLRHRNLVQLIGWCHGGRELLLVYELMPNGSLDTHLYNTGNGAHQILPWPLRHEVVLGLGSALLYLHEEWEQCVVHRDIKPSNVMLDASFKAKLGDFGLARLVDHGRGSHTTTELAGTTGYMDPECTATGRFSMGSDIYSFGVLLLEVACGRRPVVALPDGAVVHLARRVSELHDRGMVLRAADPRLNGEFDAREMECVLLVGLWCTHQDRSLRPSIRQAVSALRLEVPLPSLPARMLVATNVPVPVGLLNSVPSLAAADSDSTRTDTVYLSTTTT